MGNIDRQRLARVVRSLGPWPHNMNLDGVMTAPNHALGDYPRVRYERFADSIPADLTGKSVLDIGCSSGFYSIEMHRRGARVVAMDGDPRCLAQARLAFEVAGAKDIEVRQLDVYDVEELSEKFDVVMCFDALTRLRHPLLALDRIRDYVAKDLFVVHCFQRGGRDLSGIADDYPSTESAVFEMPGFPKMHFVERSFSSDPTQWWLPNRACVEAMLRSAGFSIAAHPEEEVYVCKIAPVSHAVPR